MPATTPLLLKRARALALLLVPLGVPLLTAAAQPFALAPAAASFAASQAAAAKSRGSLVEIVRNATARYRDLNVALAEGWVPATPCVSGPDHGAMGVHFVLPARIGDGLVNAEQPEALIYEPLSNGAMRLVGVEFIVIADDWARVNPGAGPPALDGNLMNLVGAPNRYGLPSFYELHVWAWEHNPSGSFADWNTDVSCEHQPTG